MRFQAVKFVGSEGDEAQGFHYLPQERVNVNALKYNVLSLLLHKFNDLFSYIYETYVSIFT